MRRLLRRAYTLFTFAFALTFFPALLLYRASKYGKDWHFSPNGVPVSLLSSDGKTFADGSPIIGLTHALIVNGVEERVMGLLLLVIAAGLLWGNHMRRDIRRCERHLARFRGATP